MNVIKPNQSEGRNEKIKIKKIPDEFATCLFAAAGIGNTAHLYNRLDHRPPKSLRKSGLFRRFHATKFFQSEGRKTPDHPDGHLQQSVLLRPSYFG